MAKTIATFTRPPNTKESEKQEKYEGVFRVHLEELSEILMQPEIKDLPACVFSIVGPYRSGKSFLMNYFLRYLEEKEKNPHPECPFGDKYIQLEGFKWDTDSEPVTDGTVMWKRPFVITRNSDKEKVAVILVDTQGISDSRLDPVEETFLFAVNSVISKTLIHNVEQKIQESHLRDLAHAVKAGSGDKKAEFLKETVLFTLVRDWRFENMPYGLVGGKQHLDQKLQLNETHTAKLQETREVLKNSFLDMQCYLMPFVGMPGFQARKGFKGALNDLDSEFVDHLEKLADHLFSDAFLKPKQMAGLAMTCEDVCRALEVYNEKILFGGKPMTGNEAFNEAVYDKTIRMCEQQFKQQLDTVFAKGMPHLNANEFAKKFEEIKTNVLSNLESNFGKTPLKRAGERIGDLYDTYQRKNDLNSRDEKKRCVAMAKTTYEDEMNKILGGWKTLSQENFNTQHSSAEKMALQSYADNISGEAAGITEGRNEVIAHCKTRRQHFEERNNYNYLVRCGAVVVAGGVVVGVAGTTAFVVLPEVAPVVAEGIVATGVAVKSAVVEFGPFMVDVGAKVAGVIQTAAAEAAPALVKGFEWVIRRY